VKRRPFNGNSLIARSSITAERAAGWVSTSAGSSETVTVSVAPATASLKASCMVPPMSTCSVGVIWGDIPVDSARPE